MSDDGPALTRSTVKIETEMASGTDFDDDQLSLDRTPDLSGVPPAFAAVAENDPLRFEVVDYAAAMWAVENRVDDRQYAGVEHGFLNGTPEAPQVVSALADIALDHRLGTGGPA